MKKLLLFIIIVPIMVLSAVKVYVISEIRPNQNKVKKSKTIKVENNMFVFCSKKARIEVEPFLLKDVDKYFSQKGLKNPFEGVDEGFNYIFFRIKIENKSKEDELEFSPSSVVFGEALSKDDTSIYQLFYQDKDGEKKLETIGRTFFLRPLRLPPKMWIERLIMFEYDENVPIKRSELILSNISIGKEIFEVVFPFEIKFKKEIRDGSDNER